MLLVVLAVVVAVAAAAVRLTDSPLAIALIRSFGESADSAADGCRRIGEESAK